MPPSLDAEQTADTRGVGAGAAVQATIRPCRHCRKDIPEHLYSKYEWKKSNVKESTCKSCVIGYQEYKTGEVKRVCLSCDESLASTDYSFTQWLKGKFQSRCRTCVAPEEAYYKDTIGRRCAKCEIHFASTEFPLQEWTKADTDTSLCKRCWKDATRICKTCQVRTTESGNAKHCSVCIKVKADYASNAEKKKCSICRRKFASQRGYSLTQWQAANSECRGCEGETISYHTNGRRVCAKCGHDVHAIDYALPEWRKGLGVAQCRTCVNEQVAAAKNAVAASHRTETQCPTVAGTPSQSMIKDTRTCCACKQTLSLDAFTKMQRLRKAESSTCMTCFYQSIPDLATFCFDDRDKSTKETALATTWTRGESDTSTRGECNDDGRQQGIGTTRIYTSCAMVLPPSDFTQRQLAVAEPTCRACLKPTIVTTSAWVTIEKAPALGVATTDETPSTAATTIITPSAAAATFASRISFDDKTSSKHLTCMTCHKLFRRSHFSNAQRKKEHPKCNACISRTEKKCSTCRKMLPLLSFIKAQRKKKRSHCSTCMNQTQSAPNTLKAVTGPDEGGNDLSSCRTCSPCAQELPVASFSKAQLQKEGPTCNSSIRLTSKTAAAAAIAPASPEVVP